MLISKKAAAPMWKGSKKHGCPFTNVISQNAQKSCCTFAKANFQKAAATSFTFHKGQTAKQFSLS